MSSGGYPAGDSVSTDSVESFARSAGTVAGATLVSRVLGLARDVVLANLFAAAVVIMAVKGYLTITEDGDGDFTLKKTGKPESKLSAGERKVAQELFRSAERLLRRAGSKGVFHHKTVDRTVSRLQRLVQRG